MRFGKKERLLLSPASGRVVELSAVPDEVFSSGMLGKGFAVLPDDGTVYSPMSGRVESVADARHAYTLVGEDGVELLVHIGVDTVTLGGRGFLPMVEEGASVQAGDVLARVDLSVLSEAGLVNSVVVILTEPDSIFDLRLTPGKCLGGRSEALRYRIGKE